MLAETVAMPDPTRRPTGAAIAAALSPFIGLPLSIVFLSFSAGGGRIEGLTVTWVEGGWGMYLVLLAQAGLCLVAAGLMFFGVQRGSAVMLVNAPLSSAVLAIGTFGYWKGVSATLEAITHAQPADRATILAAGTGEALSAALFGACSMAGLLAALCSGLVLGAIAQEGAARRLLIAGLGVFGSLVLLAWAASTRLSALRGGFKAIAHASPVDRLTLLAGLGEELSSRQPYVLLAVGLVAVMSALGAVLTRSTPTLAVTVPLLGLGGLFGFGAQAFAERSLREGAGAALTLRAPMGLVEFEGQTSLEPRWCVRGDSLIDCDSDGLRGPVDRAVFTAELEAIVRFADHSDQDESNQAPDVALGLTRGSTSAAAFDFFTAAAKAGVRRVALVGEAARPPLTVPGELELLRRGLELPFSMVTVDLESVSAGCSTDCVRATVVGEALVVDGETWAAARLPSVAPRVEGRVAIDGSEPLAPEVLVRLALAAAGRNRRLVLQLPGRFFIRASPLGDEGLGEVPRDEEDSGLSKAELLSVTRAHVREVQDCYERGLVKNPKLAGKIALAWTIAPSGAVSNVEVESNTLADDSVVACISSKPLTWKYPRPRTGKDVRVSFPFVFSPAE